jgi:AcrR family transcriptional regulator
MTLPTPPWQTRPERARRTAKQPLSRDVIVDAALAVLDREGIGGMSLRRVAQELGTGPASLYAHVDNLRELEDLVFERAAGEITLPVPDPARWQEQLKQLLFDSLNTMRRHPGIARFALGRIPTKENGLAVADAMLGLLATGGVPEQYCAWAVDVLGLFVAAAAYEESVELAEGQTEENMREWFDQLGVHFRALPTERYPHLVRMAPFMVQGSGDERLEFALDIMINGLAATAGTTGSPAATGLPH